VKKYFQKKEFEKNPYNSAQISTEIVDYTILELGMKDKLRGSYVRAADNQTEPKQNCKSMGLTF
jgi:hypothetical protein